MHLKIAFEDTASTIEDCESVVVDILTDIEGVSVNKFSDGRRKTTDDSSTVEVYADVSVDSTSASKFIPTLMDCLEDQTDATVSIATSSIP